MSTRPCWVTQLSRTISSLKSRARAPSFTRFSRNEEMLREYIWLACTGKVAARLIGPWIVTPWAMTVAPGWVSSQFPPISAPMSTITAPGIMSRTIPSVMRSGARRPGTIAVVITRSAVLTWAWMSSRSRASCSEVSARA